MAWTSYLTNFILLASFYTPWKHQKTSVVKNPQCLTFCEHPYLPPRPNQPANESLGYAWIPCLRFSKQISWKTFTKASVISYVCFMFATCRILFLVFSIKIMRRAALEKMEFVSSLISMLLAFSSYFIFKGLWNWIRPVDIQSSNI